MHYFTEETGKPSCMRLMSFISLLSAVAIAIMTINVVDAESKDEGLLLTYAFLVSAFAPKTVQKFAEHNHSS